MGIPVSIDASWLIIFAILTFELGTGLFPFELGIGRRSGFNLEALGLGAITSLLLFGSVLAHELSHSWMAIRRGIPVLGITLFMLGGVAQIGDEADRPATEFWVAIMGPLMSFALAAVFGIFWIWPTVLLSLSGVGAGILRPLIAMAYYLATANATLVLFNLVPAFPLDGGRVLRAALWGVLHDLPRATLSAMRIGRAIAVLFFLLAGLLLWQGNLNGVWLLLVGGFIWQAAGESYRSVVFRESLRGVPVSTIMHSPVDRVPGQLAVAELVDGYLLRRRGATFAVDEYGQSVGLVGAAQVGMIPRTRWPMLRVRDVMLPLSPLQSVQPGDSALLVMQRLMRGQADGLNEIPVMNDGQLVGVVGQEEIARYLQWKSQRA